MKRLASACLAFVLATGTAFAQSAEPPAPPDYMTEEGAAVWRILAAGCDAFTYEDDCLAAMALAIRNSAELPDADREAVYSKIRGYKVVYSFLAGPIDNVLQQNGIPVDDPAPAP
jgi:hypothetical protein